MLLAIRQEFGKTVDWLPTEEASQISPIALAAWSQVGLLTLGHPTFVTPHARSPGVLRIV